MWMDCFPSVLSQGETDAMVIRVGLLQVLPVPRISGAWSWVLLHTQGCNLWSERSEPPGLERDRCHLRVKTKESWKILCQITRRQHLHHRVHPPRSAIGSESIHTSYHNRAELPSPITHLEPSWIKGASKRSFLQMQEPSLGRCGYQIGCLLK